MNSPTKIFVPLVLLALLGVTAVFLLQQDGALAPPSVPDPVHVQPPPDRPAPGPVATDVPVVPTPTAPRTDIRTQVHDQSGKDLPQGVSGRVLTPGRAPLAGARVYLLRSTTTNPIDIWLANRRGELIPPVAAAVTDPDGRFQLGTARTEVSYDLRVVTDQYPELHHRAVRIKEQDWYDTGDLQLDQGLIVQGRVLVEGTLAPVAGAMVYMQSTNAAHTLLATPGREKGIVTETDVAGFFRFGNAPRDSTVSLAAEAPGFARVERLNLTLQESVPNEFNLELGTGQSIVGVVVDGDGRPLPGARVVATALSSKMPQTAQATADREGRFELSSLRDGPFQLVASAPNFEERIDKPVLAGADDVRIVMEQRGMVRVRVLSHTGAAIRDFTLALKRSFPNSPLGIGNLPEFRDQRVTPRDFDGDTYLLKGVPNGDFILQIQAANHAKTLSDPFTVVAGEQVPEVVVRMTMGGVIVGRVVDFQNKGVAGAVVTTDASGGFAFAGDSEFVQVFRQFMPDRVTKTSVRTEANGSFRIPLLAHGDYLLRANHPDLCEGYATEVKIDQDIEVRVPDIRLSPGAVVFGYATVDGLPGGQVKVQIGPPPSAPGQPGAVPQPGSNPFTASVITDSDGRYRFAKRVPPGTYVIQASKNTGDNNPFLTLMQMRQTSREVTVLPGQEQLEQNFNVISPR